MGIGKGRGILMDVPLSDDFMFGQVFSKIKNCKRLLDNIMGKDIGKIKTVIYQDHIEIDLLNKGIRTDISVLNDKGEIFDLEMQNKNDNIGPRSRYYQSVLTFNSLTKGMTYSQLSELYIIFICTKDPFGKKRVIYTFGDEICIEDQSIRLKTKVHKIFLYTGGTVGNISEELREILRFIGNSTETTAKDSKSSFVKVLYRDMQAVRQDPKKEVEYMSLYMMIEDAKEEGEKKGIKKGRKEGEKKGTENTLAILNDYKKNLSVEELVKKYKKSENEIMEIISVLK